MDLGLQGKHAIVTGGSRGIGKAIARELAREGVDVAIVARTKADLEATARELGAETNRRIVPFAADVTSKAQVDRMVAEAAQQLGGLHILVNSGSAPGGSATATGPIETVVDEDLLQDFNVKYVGALRCSRAVIPFMKQEGWGRIINISGANARNAGNLSGGARNAGLVHMTKTLAVQLGRHGITVNCIHPGTTRTERTPSLLAARATQLGVSPEEAERQDFAPDSPRGNAICRMVDASEVAFVTVFLASDRAWAVSGELVAATGGAGRTRILLSSGSNSVAHPLVRGWRLRHSEQKNGRHHAPSRPAEGYTPADDPLRWHALTRCRCGLSRTRISRRSTRFGPPRWWPRRTVIWSTIRCTGSTPATGCNRRCARGTTSRPTS